MITLIIFATAYFLGSATTLLLVGLGIATRRKEPHHR
jgi:hypothetical protein